MCIYESIYYFYFFIFSIFLNIYIITVINPCMLILVLNVLASLIILLMPTRVTTT